MEESIAQWDKQHKVEQREAATQLLQGRFETLQFSKALVPMESSDGAEGRM